MHFFIPTVIAVLPFLAAASPVVPRPKGVSIPIAKRSTPNNSGVVDAAKLRAHLAHVQAYARRSTIIGFPKIYYFCYFL